MFLQSLWFRAANTPAPCLVTHVASNVLCGYEPAALGANQAPSTLARPPNRHSFTDGVPIENAWDRPYEDYLALSASTHHYRMLKKRVIVDRNGVYGLMGHVHRNRHVENLLGDANCSTFPEY